MPINIPNDLPARRTLEAENIFVMSQARAQSQDIRPLQIVILNLMPKKIETETQLLRLLSNTPLQIDITLMQMASHTSKNTASEHLLAFYHTFEQLRERRFDGMILTGAPVEQLPFEEVDYWAELCQVLDWARKHVFSLFAICWGAQAALYHYFGLPKQLLPEKMFGVFPHRVLAANHPLLRGFDSEFLAPHSRHTGFDAALIARQPALEILSDSPQAGPYILAERQRPNFYVTGHGEYDRGTLAAEYWRDREQGLDIRLPANYFPGDDPAKPPLFRWRSAASLLFSNWLNYFVYQQTPYDLGKLQWHPAGGQNG